MKALFYLPLLFVAACQMQPKVSYIPKTFADLPSWKQENVTELVPQFKASCARFQREEKASWQAFCAELAQTEPGDFKALIERHLQPVELKAKKSDALFTGYYSPIIEARKTADATFKYPLRQPPEDLLTLSLKDFDPALSGQLKGRLQGNRVIPYKDRAEIEQTTNPATQAVAWLKDPIEKFGLQIQGSGVLTFADGSQTTVGYADNNGHAYTAIGRTLIHEGVMNKEDVSWQAIVTWLEQNPEQQNRIFNSNPRYIFFRTLNGAPRGAAGVPLAEGRSMAVDTTHIPLGTPVFIATTLTAEQAPYTRLLVAEDVGAAIKGVVRGDIYFGVGEKAATLAGQQNSGGRLFILLPRGEIKAL